MEHIPAVECERCNTLTKAAGNYLIVGPITVKQHQGVSYERNVVFLQEAVFCDAECLNAYIKQQCEELLY
jgi:hypothetical protein